MKKLKIILLFSIIFTIGYLFFYINSHHESKYNTNDTEFIGIITKINNNDKLVLEIEGKEKLLVNYYYKDEYLFSYSLGDKIKIIGVLEEPNSNDNFNLFSYKKYLLSKKIKYIVNASQFELVSENRNIFYICKNWVIKRINNIKNNTYLKAFILGDTSDIRDNVIKSYQDNGISHLFAVSGMHVTFLSSMLLMLLKRIIKKYYNIVLIIFLLFYMFLVNFSPSIMRAVLFLILIIIKKKLKLNIPTIYLFLLFTCLFLIYNPYIIYNSGFLYSFTISGFLIYSSQKITTKHYLKNLFLISLIAFLSGLPISIYTSFQINLISPILNLFFVPLVSLILFPCSFIVFIFPNLNYIYSLLTVLLENISLWCANVTSFNVVLAKPHLIIIFTYYIIILLTLKNKNYVFILITMLIIHNNIHYINKYPIITMLDIGQGDSILIELPHNKGNILIDTGGTLNNSNNYLSNSVIIPYLKSVGIKKLDYLVITHGDNDHIGESFNIVNRFKVNHVILNEGNNNELENNLLNLCSHKGIPILHLNKQILDIMSYKFNFISDIDKENENEDSLIVYTNLNNKNILLMGDAGKISEKQLLKEYNLPKMDILKVGHHGSKYSSRIDFLEKIKPDISLISVGLKNRFNHPSDETINNLLSVNTKILKTSINGSIRIVLMDKIKLSCSTLTC